MMSDIILSNPDTTPALLWV